MKINDNLIKLFNTIGPRATVGMTLQNYVLKNKNLMVVTSDVSTSAGLDKFRQLFPNNFVDVGIAEQNLIGVATGISKLNIPVVTTTFAPFQTLRCLEQIKVNLSYMNSNVCMIGIASGLVLGTLGFTHCCIEDIAVTRVLPNFVILSPSDPVETSKCILAAIKRKGPTYIRVTGDAKSGKIYNKNYDFHIGKNPSLTNGDDIAIIATGSITYEALMASIELKKHKIDCELINVHTIKPFDQSIIQRIKNKKFIITVEEHNIIGGLGSSVAEEISKQKINVKQFFLGIDDKYIKAGDYNYLKKKYQIDTNSIIKKVLTLFKK